MGWSGVKKPSNKIVERGDPQVQELKLVGSATNAYPGAWVIRDTADDDVSVTDSPTSTSVPAKVVGWLGYLQGNADDMPVTVDTAWAVGDRVPVLNGGGFYLVARLSNKSVTKGEYLTTGQCGMLTGIVSPGGPVVYNDAQRFAIAVAEETVDASATIKDVVVRSLI